MIIIYFLLVFPIWIIFQFTTNYKVLIGCRNFIKYSLVVVCILSLVSIAVDDMIMMRAMPELPKAKAVGIIARPLAVLLLSPLLWNIWMSIYGLNFYNSSHIENLRYFVLYLRSFKDDKKKTGREAKLLRALYTFFCPFAVGKPNELKSSDISAIRLYIGDGWKNDVLEMMKNTQIILLRVSDTPNFFWEFEQCVVNEHIHKSIFWVSDKMAYETFCKKALDQFSLQFPTIDKIADNCVVYKKDNDFTVAPLDSKKSYSNFIWSYNESRGLTSSHSDYFSGRDKSLFKQFFTWKRDPNMMAGVQEWSWTAFLLPEFYIILQRFPNRGWLYLFSLIFFLPLLFFRIPLMIFMGRNGKKMVWLSEKWESVKYFEEIHKKNNIKTIVFAICFIFGFISMLMI